MAYLYKASNKSLRGQVKQARLVLEGAPDNGDPWLVWFWQELYERRYRDVLKRLETSTVGPYATLIGAILVLFPEENRGRTIYFRSIEEVEFSRRVPVGARVRVEAQIKKLRARFGSLKLEAFVEDGLAAKGVMSFALG
jgi:hypothetical protein